MAKLILVHDLLPRTEPNSQSKYCIACWNIVDITDNVEPREHVWYREQVNRTLVTEGVTLYELNGYVLHITYNDFIKFQQKNPTVVLIWLRFVTIDCPSSVSAS